MQKICVRPRFLSHAKKGVIFRRLIASCKRIWKKNVPFEIDDRLKTLSIADNFVSIAFRTAR